MYRLISLHISYLGILKWADNLGDNGTSLSIHENWLTRFSVRGQKREKGYFFSAKAQEFQTPGVPAVPTVAYPFNPRFDTQNSSA